MTPGYKLGAYEILRELTSGGMGAVLLGRRRGPGAFEQLVAIKTIRSEYAQAAAVRAMFLDEAAILARIQHPGIATVHDFGEQAGTLFMVMEYVAGISLRSLGEGAMPPTVAARAIAEACRGLHAAHDVRDTSGALLGVVHRDISPDNVMVGFDGHVKVIDFGIALIKNRQSPVTELGMLKGKPPYMSPEQVKNEAMDRRSDVFSLGVVLHELLTGQPLFTGNSVYAVAYSVQHQAIEPPSAIMHRQLPPGLDAAVMRALERDPAKRTPTAAHLAEELERVIASAGEETLEAWAERELAAEREEHRAWLASVTAGADAPRMIGRPTGSHTAVASRDDAHAKTALREPAPDPGERPELDATEAPRRRSIARLLVAFALLAAAVIGALLLMPSTSPDAGSVDASLVSLADDARVHNEVDVSDARTIGAQVVLDDARGVDAGVAIVVAGATDASVSVIDARGRDADPRRGPIDAGRRTPPVDASRSLPPTEVDAAAAPQATGTATLTIGNPKSGGAVTVILDGKNLGSTPIIGRAVAAGPHTLELVSPIGAPTQTTTFELAPGERKTVRPD